MENTAEKCSDGIDNDGNGYVDCGDFSCSQSDDINVAQVCQESITAMGSAAEANQKCDDGIDNDGDGFTDCNDWDCSWNPLVTVCADNRICE